MSDDYIRMLHSNSRTNMPGALKDPFGPCDIKERHLQA